MLSLQIDALIQPALHDRKDLREQPDFGAALHVVSLGGKITLQNSLGDAEGNFFHPQVSQSFERKVDGLADNRGVFGVDGQILGRERQLRVFAKFRLDILRRKLKAIADEARVNDLQMRRSLNAFGDRPNVGSRRRIGLFRLRPRTG